MSETATLSSSVPRSRWRFWVFVTGMLVLTVVFLGLGKWQLDRLAWKEGLIAEVAAHMHLPPTPFPAAAQWPHLDVDACSIVRSALSAIISGARRCACLSASTVPRGFIPAPATGL
jgi:surfeit locus 1 family protein